MLRNPVPTGVVIGALIAVFEAWRLAFLEHREFVLERLELLVRGDDPAVERVVDLGDLVLGQRRLVLQPLQLLTHDVAFTEQFELTALDIGDRCLRRGKVGEDRIVGEPMTELRQTRVELLQGQQLFEIQRVSFPSLGGNLSHRRRISCRRWPSRRPRRGWSAAW